MATQTIYATSFPGLGAPQLGLYDAGTGAQVRAPVAATPVGAAAAGIYSAAFTGVPVGRYMVVVLDAGAELTRDYVNLLLATNTYYTEGMQAPAGGGGGGTVNIQVEDKAITVI